ncbi:DUF6676 family protein [Corynebacterium renale]|uniref:Uncharacterized protein n=1 Tax=Corynebacterium renale TaxID=1724 RepID=A0A2A9DPT0_9CORY|nr:hypothetical protein ATK06_1817 [Corynebacterium renale]SQI26056.1 1-deoxy-D-xylulose-5-phosphate synthase [Corynebacterium renale]
MGIPANVDIESLKAQLSAGNAAFEPATSTVLDHATLEDALLHANSLAAEDGGTVAVAFLDSTPTQLADLRDIAQDLQLSTTHDTVIIQAPGGVGAASDTLTRAQIEIGEHALISSVPERGPASFIEAAQSAESIIPWGLLVAVATAAVLAVLGATLTRTLRQ